MRHEKAETHARGIVLHISGFSPQVSSFYCVGATNRENHAIRPILTAKVAASCTLRFFHGGTGLLSWEHESHPLLITSIFDNN